MSIAAAADLELHCVDLSQAFIQADKIEKGVNGLFFITPPVGYDEEPWVVYEVCRPLYGVASSSRALHLTLAAWMKHQGFQTAGFEESIWVRPADATYEHQIIMSTHIDDNLMACKSLDTLNKFKKSFLSRFDWTDDKDVNTYLGC
eukprot:1862213-Rhodomonas_salina.1